MATVIEPQENEEKRAPEQKSKTVVEDQKDDSSDVGMYWVKDCEEDGRQPIFEPDDRVMHFAKLKTKEGSTLENGIFCSAFHANFCCFWLCYFSNF